ncbi:MAG TPA: hypothetical protein VF534_14175, partial [Paraburkholderia sp.]
HPQNPTSWSPNSTRTNKKIYNQHRATPNPAESVTFPKSAVTFAEIRSCLGSFSVLTFFAVQRAHWSVQSNDFELKGIL